jgi:sugar O-acyltransferase (sialic acid O-acetyltransferase NeuD family)
VGVIESNDEFEIEGFVDSRLRTGDRLLGYPILGGNDLLDGLVREQKYLFFITVGHIRSCEARVRLFSLLKGLNAPVVPKIISASAFVSHDAQLGMGGIVMHQAVVNAGARIGDNVILNNHSLVEHDCVIGDHSHISTGTMVNGDCIIGDRVFIGSGAILVNGITVTSDVMIGAGTVVTSSITEPGSYVGNPARKIK